MEGGPSRVTCARSPTRRDQRTYDQLVVVVPPTLNDHWPLLFIAAAAELAVELVVALSAGVPTSVALATPPAPDEAPTATLPPPAANVDVVPPVTAVDDAVPPAKA